MIYLYDASDRAQRKHLRKYSAFTLVIGYLIILAIALTGMLLLSFVSTTDGDRSALIGHGLCATALIITAFALLLGLVTIPLAGGRSIRTELNDDRMIITENGYGFRREIAVRYEDIEKISIDRLSQTALWRRIDGTLFIAVRYAADTVDGAHNTYRKPRSIIIAAVASEQEADTLIHRIRHADRRSS